MAGDLSFPRRSRLCATAEFDAVFRNRRAVKGQWFHLHYGPAVAEARLGLVIPKKFAKRAVLRNLLKRIGRESFRRVRCVLPTRELVLRLAVPAGKLFGREARAGWRAEIDDLLLRVPR